MKAKTRKVLVVGGAVAGVYLLNRYLSGKSLLAGLGVDTSNLVVAPQAKPAVKAPVLNPNLVVGAGTAYGESPFAVAVAKVKASSPLVKYGIPLALAAGLIYWFVLRKKPAPASAPTV